MTSNQPDNSIPSKASISFTKIPFAHLYFNILVRYSMDNKKSRYRLLYALFHRRAG
uniref:Uncharacterized protein n=1 Tax=Utricularia reniformis TaxID=192314 RepID=A0A1Y0B2A7_9LAMI|nr:hypothetical protein AEK19_MT1329 [Utricularia reniformis]ART31527.1 hypothetical protein AEK19_MT1329 [Utricularia reniformis]